MADRVDWDFLHDYFHDRVIKRGFDAIANILSKPVDVGLIDGVVNGIGWLVQRVSRSMRRIQTGYVRVYAVVLFIGVVAVISIYAVAVYSDFTPEWLLRRTQSYGHNWTLTYNNNFIHSDDWSHHSVIYEWRDTQEITSSGWHSAPVLWRLLLRF